MRLPACAVFLCFVFQAQSNPTPHQTQNISNMCAAKCDCTATTIDCQSAIALSDLQPLLTSNLITLNLKYARLPNLFPEDFNNATSLQKFSCNRCHFKKSAEFQLDEIHEKLIELSLTESKLTNISAAFQLANRFNSLKTLNLSRNQFESEENLINEESHLSLQVLDLSHNKLRKLPSISSTLQVLDLSWNHIETLEGTFPERVSLRTLNLSQNSIEELVRNGNLSSFVNLKELDLSNNRLRHLTSNHLQGLISLQTLILARNSLQSFSAFPSLSNVRSLIMSDFKGFFFNTSHLRNLTDLRTLDVSGSGHLQELFGQQNDLSSLQLLNVAQCALEKLPANLSLIAPSLQTLSVNGNTLSCDQCMLSWFWRLSSTVNMGNTSSIVCSSPPSAAGQTISSVVENGTVDCRLGVVEGSNGSTTTVTFKHSALLYCNAFGEPSPTLRWYRGPFGNLFLGGWDGVAQSLIPSADNPDPEHYRVLPGGVLRVSAVYQSDMNHYWCRADNVHGTVSTIVKLRIDYSAWNIVKIYSIICGIATALCFFALNCIWSMIRGIILWRINVAERTSRVRKLLEGMERYRQRQVESLQERYATRVDQIRDNYRTQVDQLRKSYTSQMMRFRDYKAAQMESVSAHVDNARENYASQVGRMREYGCRQMERVSDSYQSQLHRIRTFSLQQRLRLMRQYKIKQRYLNKIMDSVHQSEVDHGDIIIMPSLVDEEEDDLQLQLPEALLSPAGPSNSSHADDDAISTSTYHSLPDEDGDEVIVIGENGRISVVHLEPIRLNDETQL